MPAHFPEASFEPGGFLEDHDHTLRLDRGKTNRQPIG
jgi:hypothetical protein